LTKIYTATKLEVFYQFEEIKPLKAAKMRKELWTSADIKKLFRAEDRLKSVQTLYNAENKGEVPKAERIPRGKIQVRNWRINQLPAIGKKYGFLNKPDKQIVMCKYIQKGGVLKTTTTYNEARTFALNGIKTLVIGQDFECSITDIIYPRQDIIKLEDSIKPLGLYHYFVEGASINEIIKHTELPTLDIIPETHDLSILEKWLNQQKRREYIYKDRLIPELSNYDVIIFDNNPGWTHLVENALVASHAVVCPLGCNLLAYNASETNMASILEFQSEMRLDTQKIIAYPTLLNKSSLSQQAYGQYLTRLSDYIINKPIRYTVAGEEALMQGQSIFEAAPSSALAQQYYELLTEEWKALNQPYDEYIKTNYSSFNEEEF